MIKDFPNRHIGPRDDQIQEMLSELGFSSLEDLSNKVIPPNIILDSKMDLPNKMSEPETINRLREFANENSVYNSFIGMGYYGTFLPAVIQRNILENPGWYTQYTPYQAEISQGRLEALLNFQTMVSDITGLPMANASLLDEATAAAEPLGITLKIIEITTQHFNQDVFGAIVQYPDTNGSIQDQTELCEAAHDNQAHICIATDLLALALLKSPGEMGADVAVGSAQRFGVPTGYGGPHAAFFSTNEKFKRKIPGRIIGVSQDSLGKPALRMALQTREQHIRREKATSNICTAQVLLAIISGMYAVYHGPDGIKEIALRVNQFTRLLAVSLKNAGIDLVHNAYFDTIRFKAEGWKTKANEKQLNFRDHKDGTVGISIDETTTEDDIISILDVFNVEKYDVLESSVPDHLERTSSFLENSVFHKYRSETDMLRYIHTLETKDLSLNTSMIPLGSCTMKLNSTTEMTAVTWPEFSNIHPFAPVEQVEGYQSLIQELNDWLISITGFDAISMQPNSGAQGEYAGLMIIRAYHKAQGNDHRDTCLIPDSAHGTNPASAVMAGMRVVVVDCDDQGNIDIDDLKKKIMENEDNLSSVMITYPSTHGVFESTIKEICEMVHNSGGQVYMDGANLNALVGVCKPGDFGADVMHINLHKTFCIPHGGGGPGMGPIVCKDHLSPFLPGHTQIETSNKQAITAVSAAPFGSSSILPISWSYIAMMGNDGLKKATQVAILNANYLAKKLEDYYPVLYRGDSGYHAHEFIIDIRPIKDASGINEEDIAKRLMDYGFHAPTMSWPVPGTMMIEPTESESKPELDRFIEAMISIKKEIDNVTSGEFDPTDNPLKNAPHTAEHALSENWPHPYSDDYRDRDL